MMKVLYLLLLFSVYLIFSDNINYLIKNISHWAQGTFSTIKQTSIERHIAKTFMVISKDNKEKRDERIFWVVTSAFFLVSAFSLLNVLGLSLITLLLIISMSIIPYVYIRGKLVVTQRTGSFEGEALLKELFTQYKLANGNIMTTMSETVKHLTDKEPVTRRALFRLSLKAPSIKTEAEANEAINDFIYAINTNWVKSLGHNLFSAIREKTDIYAGLENLLEDCKIINANLEADKRGNVEASSMFYFLTPVFLVVFGKMLLETTSLTNVIKYQFHTPTGILLVCLILISFATATVGIKVLKTAKYDF